MSKLQVMLYPIYRLYSLPSVLLLTSFPLLMSSLLYKNSSDIKHQYVLTISQSP